MPPWGDPSLLQRVALGHPEARDVKYLPLLLVFLAAQKPRSKIEKDIESPKRKNPADERPGASC